LFFPCPVNPEALPSLLLGRGHSPTSSVGRRFPGIECVHKHRSHYNNKTAQLFGEKWNFPIRAPRSPDAGAGHSRSSSMDLDGSTQGLRFGTRPTDGFFGMARPYVRGSNRRLANTKPQLAGSRNAGVNPQRISPLALALGLGQTPGPYLGAGGGRWQGSRACRSGNRHFMGTLHGFRYGHSGFWGKKPGVNFGHLQPCNSAARHWISIFYFPPGLRRWRAHNRGDFLKHGSGCQQHTRPRMPPPHPPTIQNAVDKINVIPRTSIFSVRRIIMEV